MAPYKLPLPSASSCGKLLFLVLVKRDGNGRLIVCYRALFGVLVVFDGLEAMRSRRGTGAHHDKHHHTTPYAGA